MSYSPLKLILITCTMFSTVAIANAERPSEPKKEYGYVNPTIVKVKVGERLVSNIVTESQPYTVNTPYSCPEVKHVRASMACNKTEDKFADFTTGCPYVAAHNVTIDKTCHRQETLYRNVSVDRSYMEPIYEDKYTCSRGKIAIRYYPKTKTSEPTCQYEIPRVGGACRDSSCSDGSGTGK